MANTSSRYSDSWIPLAFLAGILFAIYLLWQVLLVFILAALFAFVVYPVVAIFDRKLPHTASIVVVYLILTIILIIVVGLLVPVVTQQTQQLAENIPSYVQRVRDISANLQEQYVSLPDRWRVLAARGLDELQNAAIRVTRESIPALIGFFRGFFTLFFVPFLAFFMLLDYKGYKQMMIAVVPRPHRAVVEDLLSCMGNVLWDFLKGQAILMLTIGLLDTVGLYIVGMPYAVLFGILGGLLELIPNFGPIATTVIITGIGLLIDPVLGLKAAIVVIGVQILENVLLVPIVMSKAVGLDPVTLAFAIFLGGMAAGVLGAVIAIPLAMMVKVVIIYFYADRQSLPSQDRGICQPSEKRKPIRRRNRAA